MIQQILTFSATVSKYSIKVKELNIAKQIEKYCNINTHGYLSIYFKQDAKVTKHSRTI